MTITTTKDSTATTDNDSSRVPQYSPKNMMKMVNSGGSSSTTTCDMHKYTSIGSAYDALGSGGGGAKQINYSNPFFYSGGDGTAATTLGYVFTNAQWMELERQAMIYKYMVACLPIPQQLLSMDPTNLPYSSWRTCGGGGGGGAVNLRFTRGGGDPEPWRCRRTDGKKWRCSKEVAPDHKYCERHLHRGRPRSRKPVELHVKDYKNIKSCQNSQESTVSAVKNDAASFHCVPWPFGVEGAVSQPLNQNHVFLSKAIDKATNFDTTTASVSTCKEPSNLEWVVNYQQQEPLDQSTTFLSEKKHNQILDLWSNGSSSIDNTCSLSTNENFELTPLTLSIANNSNDNSELGLAKVELTRNQECSGSNIPGGPLAEVLQLTENRDSVSSPSGVLPRTIASFYDSSGNSSPTTIASSSVTKTGTALLWFS